MKAHRDHTPAAGCGPTLPEATFVQVEGDKVRSEQVYHYESIAEQLERKAKKD